MLIFRLEHCFFIKLVDIHPLSLLIIFIPKLTLPLLSSHLSNNNLPFTIANIHMTERHTHSSGILHLLLTQLDKGIMFISTNIRN